MEPSGKRENDYEALKTSDLSLSLTHTHTHRKEGKRKLPDFLGTPLAFGNRLK